MKTIAIIQARLNSKRLPNKVMLKILDRPILWHIHNRLNSCKNLDNVVISTGEKERNLAICNFADEFHIPYFSGSELDVIKRMYETAIKFDASSIVRITGDCPLVDPKIVEKIISEYVKHGKNYDMVTNTFTLSFPHGLEIELYSTKFLKKLNSEIKKSEFREWFSIYIENNFEKFKILEIKNNEDLSKFRWTLDYPEDFKLIQIIYEQLFDEKRVFGTDEILSLLKRKPELLKINSKYVGEHNIDAPKD